MTHNLLTDIPGVRVGHAQDAALASGVTAVLFDDPAVASLAIHGGAPGTRDTALLDPEMTVPGVNGLVLSGGSAFGLDAAGGVMAWLRQQGCGFLVGRTRVPIVPGAILFDLHNSGDKNWDRMPPYWDLGYRAAAAAAGGAFTLGSVGAGLGATTANLKGGLGSASALTQAGFTVAALVVVNALGQATVGSGPHWWAAPFERGDEFGALGWPLAFPDDALAVRTKGDAPENTTLAIIVTNAALTKAQAKRLAVMAHDGFAHALRPTHAALDGDIVFAAATGRIAKDATERNLTELGTLAADCVARAIARGLFEATVLPFAGALPSWRDRFGSVVPPRPLDEG
ncbi:P1 family peptidase [Lichenihabitans sp. PAMC28606]|uniref:P1 family peptidase n=1 Tax=Lichenihabitans sp. PAMC28606 TaxID=2880932 RepID=UPI001D09F204|nr:P1 family peptidase [Lichenihabitans sp. PAMC28606]UDL94678.1 P1 family peptidase [Lichenihabitans sp. PAMC28606]